MDKRFLNNFAFGRLRTSSEDFGLFRKTSDFFGNLRKWSCRLQKSQQSQDKNLTLISQKKLAGISLLYDNYDQCLTHDFALPVTSRFLAINLRTFSGDRQANSERISVSTVANPCLAPFLVDAKPFTRRFTLYFNSSQQEMSSSLSSSSLLSSVFW